ncbi:MAG: hypothetical protein MUC86_12080 [Burkholderiaceae bacterium]|jgi:hypothetical protein|nr:hypothetical protein [Burkholderiaceae bacterium]
MSAHVFHPEFDVRLARGEVSKPSRAPARSPVKMPVSRAALIGESSGAAATAPGWLDRLARWAERQPPHHRLGSYLLRS